MKLLLLYLLIINAISFLFMLADKRRAQKNRWRIPEYVLLNLALFGGSLGCLLGMYTVRHKTRHPRFVIGVPLMLVLQVLIFLLLR